MHAFIRNVLLSCFLLFSLSACSDNPVKADLIAFEKIAKVAFDPTMTQQTLAEMSRAKTNEEKAALMAKAAGQFRQVNAIYEQFQPKSPEVKAINDKLKLAIADSAAASDEGSAAFARADASQLVAIGTRMQANQRKMIEAANEMIALGKKEGV